MNLLSQTNLLHLGQCEVGKIFNYTNKRNAYGEGHNCFIRAYMKNVIHSFSSRFFQH